MSNVIGWINTLFVTCYNALMNISLGGVPVFGIVIVCSVWGIVISAIWRALNR